MRRFLFLLGLLIFSPLDDAEGGLSDERLVNHPLGVIGTAYSPIIR